MDAFFCERRHFKVRHIIENVDEGTLNFFEMQFTLRSVAYGDGIATFLINPESDQFKKLVKEYPL